MQKYSGGCHCGQVNFEIEGSLDGVIACNCSHCGMKGLHLIFVPKAKFNLLSGEGALKMYHFNKNVIDHQFCTNCGVEPFALSAMPDGTPMVAINVRCLSGVDQATIKPVPFNGQIL